MSQGASVPSLGLELAEQVARLTLQKTAAIGLEHARANLPHIRQSIADLNGPHVSDKKAAIVVSAGPSLYRTRTIERIKGAEFPGIIVATDGALGHCLRVGLLPHFVVSVDPHPTRMVRLYGDPDMDKRPPDDYFQRQDLYPEMLRDEAARNRELMELINRYGPKMKALLSTSVAPAVTRRVLDCGMETYWWSPIYDDYEVPGSVTRQVYELTKAPCIVTGGNTGTSAWVLAAAVLGCQDVALVGMDLSYHRETPLTHTQYYTELRDLLGDAVGEAYIHVENPYLGETWYTDPTYWWYRQVFLELAAQSPAITYNCSEGGILFGESIRWASLDEFLVQARSARA